MVFSAGGVSIGLLVTILPSTLGFLHGTGRESLRLVQNLLRSKGVLFSHCIMFMVFMMDFILMPSSVLQDSPCGSG